MFKLTPLSNYVRKVGTDEWHRVDASQEYKDWLEKGNTPAPAETPDEIAARLAREAKEAQMAQTLRDNLPTYAQVQTAIDNIGNLNDAKAFLKKLAAVTYIHIKGDNV